MRFIPFKKTVEGRKSAALDHFGDNPNFLVLFRFGCRVRNASHFYISAAKEAWQSTLDWFNKYLR